MNLTSRRLRLSIACGATLLVTACAGSGDDSSAQVEWTWDHGLSIPGTVMEEIVVDELPDLISEATEGRVKVNVLPGALPPTETLNAVSAGRVQGGTLIPVYYGDTPLLNYSTLPFLLSSNEELRTTYEANEDVLSATLEERGVKPMAMGPWASQVIMSKSALRDVDDFHGQRIRAWGGQSAAMLEAFGAAGTTTVLNEVYPSLQRGVIDGAGLAISSVVALNLAEVAEYTNAWPTSQPYFILALNQSAFDDLSDADQEAVQEVFDRIYEDVWDRTKQENDAHFDGLADSDTEVIVPSESAVAEARELSRFTWETWAKDNGPEAAALLERVKAALA